MLLTTISTEWDTWYFTGENNEEVLNQQFELEAQDIPYIINQRNIKYEVLVEHYDFDKGMEYVYCDTIEEAICEYLGKAMIYGEEANIFLTNVDTDEVIKCVENFVG